jgi:hypothetical protein
VTTILYLIFGLASGKEWRISLSNPRTDLTALEVQTAMQAIIDTKSHAGPDTIGGRSSSPGPPPTHRLIRAVRMRAFARFFFVEVIQ